MSSDLAITTVRYDRGRVSLSGDVDQDVVITAQSMLHHLLETASQRSIDLIAIATGVYALDRAFKRERTVENESGIRTLRVAFEVSDFKFWKRADITEQLTDLLYLLSGDTWLVSFVKRISTHEAKPAQRRLDLQRPFPTRVALYSGGLDSAAGLANRLRAGDQTYMLLTVGHHDKIRAHGHAQVEKLRCLMKAPMLHHADFRVRLDGGVAGVMKRQEQSQRVRGFLFCAAAALLADACEIDEIELFENGVGAVNLPLTEGGLLDGMFTRGAHPGFLLKMESLTNKLFGKPLRFSLPFLGQTKAEMLRPLVAVPHIAEWLKRSMSCVHTSIRVRGKRHCGRCPACIERRQAFRCAGIAESVNDYDTDIYSQPLTKKEDRAYLLTYLQNARWWMSGDDIVKNRLARHCLYTDSTHLPMPQIENLLTRHAAESLSTYAVVEQSGAT